MKLIYACDDDIKIREILKVFLENSGYSVVLFENGDTLFETLKDKIPDLVLLDVMMPGSDGFTICNKIRAISKVPIIILTAKDSELDYIAGLSIGSDDYMTKPFKPSVLIAKINALLRRVELEKQSGKKVDTNISFGDILYDAKAHQILVNGQVVDFTQTEMKFLLYFLKRPEQAIKKDELLNEIWGFDSEIESRVADETNRRVRKKLTIALSNVSTQTVWGYGFKLVIKENNDE